MGKQGPCRHCGVTSTPLWRNGPPEKPVLCNACGSRWRTKGSLTNYTPLHCRGPLDSDEIEAPTVRQISFKPKEHNPHKKKQNNNVVGIKHEFFEGDISNRSSSGSVISCSESCAQFGTTGASNLTGPAQSHAWDPLVPSKRRTCGPYSKASPVEKLAKDLYTILHKQQLSNVSGYSEEDLLYECETPLGSIETGHGGVLIRYPNSKTLQEESVASSLPLDSKPCATNGAFVNTDCKGMSFSNETRKKLASQATEGHARRDSVSDEKLDILRHRDSPLGSTDLKDIATLEVFMKHLSQEEQQRLMRYLPSIDNTKPPESLKSMFQNPQFIESLPCFQKVLLEGIFDHSFSGANDEDRRSLKRLVLLNLTKSKWVEHYNKLKDVKGKCIAGGKKATTPANYARHPNLTPLKRFRDSHNPQYEELKGDKRSPSRTSKSGDTNPTSMNSSSKLIHEVDNFIASEVASLSSTSFFASPPDQRSVMGSFTCTGESSDHREELLLDVPINGSFPDAELLFRPWDKKPFLSNNPSSSFTS